MKIAQIAPLQESVPPRLYGGTERVVSYLTEELVRQGHDVTLFASGDSKTAGKLKAICPQATRLSKQEIPRPLAWDVLQAEIVAQEAHKFDVIHSHADFLMFPQIRDRQIPAVTTMHGRLDIPDLFPLFKEFNDMRLVSISDAQRAPMSWANWVATVHHGLPEKAFTARESKGEYLAFLGRVSPEKGLPSAIRIAKMTGLPLRIAAKVDPTDRKYFEKNVKPLLNDPQLEFLGEIGDDQKCSFLSNAHAVLFPINWPEPFGLVMIESLACGTPVIAFPGGAVSEILEDGVTGFIVRNAKAAAEAVKRIPTISRNRCREVFETRFSTRRMCEDYVQVYERIAEQARVAA
ncbi:glycosyltransferase family 4 protein [Occallatibacter riparius]|uniref:Glycosyltransferase family 4 protein n=1 Tax=Occallatibacter riparius TaxID=1002689 RepID=A0A9J7BVH5_9BACT|nr:glycosyltransferase family 4 protein [Occallatibacter riparius]UWZ85786.1 glycosyltransferase family 4 protein [Occallatibacter riparius]